MHPRFQVRRTIAHAAGERQRTRLNLALLRVRGRNVVARAASHAVVHVSTHSQACTTRALARAVSRAGGHMRHHFSKSNAPWLTRTATRSARCLNRALLRVCRRKRCRTRGLARECPRGHTRADARDARPGARCLTVVRSRSQGSNSLSFARPTNGSARCLNSGLLSVWGRVVALKIGASLLSKSDGGHSTVAIARLDSAILRVRKH